MTEKRKRGRPRGRTKKAITFTVDINTLKDFQEVCVALSINQSSFVEKRMRDFLHNNGRQNTQFPGDDISLNQVMEDLEAIFEGEEVEI